MGTQICPDCGADVCANCGCVVCRLEDAVREAFRLFAEKLEAHAKRVTVRDKWRLGFQAGLQMAAELVEKKSLKRIDLVDLRSKISKGLSKSTFDEIKGQFAVPGTTVKDYVNCLIKLGEAYWQDGCLIVEEQKKE